MNYYEALRLRAIRAIQKPDEDAQLRHIHRWYSRTFHTPLHMVAELDPVDIFTAFYEQTYEDMDENEREDELERLLETPEERIQRLIAKDIERADAFEFAKFTEEEEKRKEIRKIADLKAGQVQKFGSRIPETGLPKELPAVALKDLKELPPDIEMKFMSESDFEAELDGPGTMIPGRQSSK